MEDQVDLPPKILVEDDSIIVWDERLASILYSTHFYGKPLGLRKADPGRINRPLVLSFFDAKYLLDAGIIELHDGSTTFTSESFNEYAAKYYEDFVHKFSVYKHLRRKGYIVRPGMKFGSDFVIYRKGPGIDHSQWVVHVEKDQTELRAIEIVRAGRLAASVKKRYLIASVDSDNQPVFYSFDRVKI